MLTMPSHTVSTTEFRAKLECEPTCALHRIKPLLENLHMRAAVFTDGVCVLPTYVRVRKVTQHPTFSRLFHIGQARCWCLPPACETRTIPENTPPFDLAHAAWGYSPSPLHTQHCDACNTDVLWHVTISAWKYTCVWRLISSFTGVAINAVESATLAQHYARRLASTQPHLKEHIICARRCRTRRKTACR